MKYVNCGERNDWETQLASSISCYRSSGEMFSGIQENENKKIKGIPNKALFFDIILWQCIGAEKKLMKWGSQRWKWTEISMQSEYFFLPYVSDNCYRYYQLLSVS